jgi:hypothetical protein
MSDRIVDAQLDEELDGMFGPPAEGTQLVTSAPARMTRRPPPQNSVTTTDGTQASIELRAETASVAVAAQAEALVRARYTIALARPRDWDLVRERLLRACRRPRFAAAAIYRKPIGKGVEGPSIRFAEECARSMGNLDLTTMIVFDDGDKRVVRVVATDLEPNVSWPKDVVIEKLVERRNPGKGQEVVGTRTNSRGELVYLVRATEDDLLNKQAALESKAQRGNILRLVPADIVEEGLDVCRDVRAHGDVADPEAARKRVLDAFASLGVSAAEIKAYLGTPDKPANLATLQPAQLDELRAIYTSIRDGESTWAEFTGKKPDADAAPMRGAAALKEHLAARAGKGDA